MSKYRITNSNKERIAELLSFHKIAYWNLAEAIGVHENTIAKWMRCPTDEQAERITEAIEDIVDSRN